MDKQLKSKANTQANIYNGDIKLTLKKGNTPYKVVKQHNAGTIEFFEYILNVVKGSVLVNDRPGIVKLIYGTSGAETVSRYGTIYENLTDAYSSGTSELPQATITYSFVIPETVVEQGKILSGLQLESLSGTVYAKVSLSAPITISTNTNIELDWNLNICNN